MTSSEHTVSKNASPSCRTVHNGKLVAFCHLSRKKSTFVRECSSSDSSLKIRVNTTFINHFSYFHGALKTCLSTVSRDRLSNRINSGLGD